MYRQLAQLIRNQKNNPTKTNLIDFIQEKICKYSNEKDTPSDQIKGMNRLLRDLLNLDNEYFGN